MILNGSACIGGGCECHVFPVDDQTVKKVYLHKRMRDKAVGNQKLLHKHGLAPAVFECGWERSYCGTVWTYISERADTGPSRLSERFEVGNALHHATKLFLVDPHDNNFGRLNGRLVLIDCGDCSIEDSSWAKTYLEWWEWYVSTHDDQGDEA